MERWAREREGTQYKTLLGCAQKNVRKKPLATRKFQKLEKKIQNSCWENATKRKEDLWANFTLKEKEERAARRRKNTEFN